MHEPLIRQMRDAAEGRSIELSGNHQSTDIGRFALNELRSLGVTPETEAWCRKVVSDVKQLVEG